MNKNLPDYLCDGICENCEKRKWFKKGKYYSCDPEKIKGSNVIPPIPVCNFNTLKQKN